MGKTVKDIRFEEAKLRMVMRLRNVSREEAKKSLSTHSTVCVDIAGKHDDDLLISAEEFFSEM